ncbi:aldo/keto reductase [Micrococcaceae bacterium RIT802]|nr:aldo/keto reductase [Micrococcaceae bacterium RIT 802]
MTTPQTSPAGTTAAATDPYSGLVLGTMTFGDTVDEATAARMLDTALDAGIRHIDTANAYVGGETEKMLARLLGGRRDEVFLASKAGMPHPDAGDDALLSGAALRRSVEASLSRLGTDRLDLFYLHQPDDSTPLEETLTAVAELAAEGKILALGVSNYAAWQIADVEAAAAAVGAPAPVVAQQLYNLVARRIEDEYLPFAASHGVRTMVYNPLGGGLLTGKHSFGERPAEGRFGDSRLAAMYTQRYWDATLFEAIDALSGIAAEAGLTLIELSLRWLAHHPGVDSLLLGGSKPAQLESNIAAISAGPLPADVITACDAVGASLRGPMPAYNR